MTEKEKWFANFEKMGEDQVRLYLEEIRPHTSVQSNQIKGYIREWLAPFNAQARQEASVNTTETKRIAGSAKNAAWAAAIAAIIAAIAATFSAFIAFSGPF
jgi:hypothetical protein